MYNYVTTPATKWSKDRTLRARTKIFQQMPDGSLYNAALDRNIKAENFQTYVMTAAMDGIQTRVTKLNPCQ
jgi:hypothetical protein